MARILIAPLTSQYTLTKAFRDELRKYGDDVSIFEGDKDMARTLVNGVDVLLIIVDEAWEQHFSEASDALALVVEEGLTRSNLITMNIFLDQAELPPVMELPEPLRALAYTSGARLESPETLERDTRLISKQLYMNFKRMNAESSQTQDSTQGKSSSGRLPTNVIIVLTVVFVALALILISRVRLGNDDEEDTPPESMLFTADEIAANTITLGLAAGLSEGMETRGTAMLNGAELALAKRPSIIVGDVEIMVDLVTTDSRCSARGGLQAAEILASDTSLAAVIGHMCDSSCAAAASIYDNADIAVISPACTQVNLVDNSVTFNRTVPAADDYAILAAEFVYDLLDAPTVMVIHDEIILGGELARLFDQTYTDLGGEIVFVHGIESTSASIPDLIAEIEATNPGLIYFAGRAYNAVRIQEALLEAEIDIPLLLGDHTILEEYIREAGEAADDTLILQPERPASPELSTITTEYQNTYGEAPADLIFASSFDAVNIILDSLEATATLNEDGTLNFDREDLLNTIRTYNGEGILGSYNCGNIGNCLLPVAAPYIVREGEAVPY